jgi:hypothetical protein
MDKEKVFDEQWWFKDNINKIPSDYYDEDSLFHYTTNKNCVEILKSETLNGSQRKNSSDPFEGKSILVSDQVYSSSDSECEQIINSTNDEVFKIKKDLKVKLKESFQVSFCVNDLKNGELGFLKPRMWERYGDKFKGVCLVFSKKQLIKENKNIDEKGLVNYLFYSQFNPLKFEIRRNQIDKTKETYLTEINKKITTKLFSKHNDFKGENEFKIVLYSTNKLSNLNIRKSLKGVIISLESEQLNTKNIKSFCDENKKHFHFIQWSERGVKVLDKDDFNVPKIKIPNI